MKIKPISYKDNRKNFFNFMIHGRHWFHSEKLWEFNIDDKVYDLLINEGIKMEIL